MEHTDPQLSTPVFMPDEWVIFLDMDGVCADFQWAALRECLQVQHPSLFGHSLDDAATVAMTKWPAGVYDIAEVAGIDPDLMWKKIDGKDDRFWRRLPVLPWFEELYGRLDMPEAQVVFATGCSWHAPSAFGKLAWLQDRFGRDFKHYVLTTVKTLLAGPKRILIDDRQDAVTDFNKAGGHGILFPRIWNVPRPELVVDFDRVEYVVEFVNTMMNGEADQVV